MRASARRLRAPGHGQLGTGDFAHLAPLAARLNHGSFGAAPTPVLARQTEIRDSLLANFDEWYFSNRLDGDLQAASSRAGQAIGVHDPHAVCLVENATVAVAVVAQRWALALYDRQHWPRSGTTGGVLLLNFCYAAVENAMRALVGRAGAPVALADLPFPCASEEDLLVAWDRALTKEKPAYVMIDHITSQPAMVLPLEAMVEMCRQHGVQEVAVDAAHAVGNLPSLDAPSLGADWYFSNLHKWACNPPTACVLHAPPPVLEATQHVVPSWSWPHGGLGPASRWTGTRDYSAFLAVPHALDYLDEWRAPGTFDTAQEHNRRKVTQHARMLAEAWDTELPQPESTMCAMAMVQLPTDLRVADAAGQPGKGVRSTLRDRFGVEAAVGAFEVDGVSRGFVRLSHAMYNTDDEFELLRDTVLELLDEQRRGEQASVPQP